MTLTIDKNPKRLIHIARILIRPSKWRYLLLLETEDKQYCWYFKSENQTVAYEEAKAGVLATTIEEALRIARRTWQGDYFRTVICGFRYTLPERDEHGINALFYQMAASYSSPNGIYYDDELGNNCYVQNASEEALNLWRKTTR